MCVVCCHYVHLHHEIYPISVSLYLCVRCSPIQTHNSQLSILQCQRKELQQLVQTRSPAMTLYHQQRKELKDNIMSRAASLAGLRATVAHNSQTSQELQENLNNNSKLLKVREMGAGPALHCVNTYFTYDLSGT